MQPSSPPSFSITFPPQKPSDAAQAPPSPAHQMPPPPPPPLLLLLLPELPTRSQA